MQVAAEVQPFHLRQLALGVGVKVYALPADGVGQQHLGGEARRGDAAVFQQANGLEERGAEGHGISGRAMN